MPLLMSLSTLLNSELWCSRSTTLQDRIRVHNQMLRVMGKDYGHISVTLLQRPMELPAGVLVYQHWNGVQTSLVFGRCTHCQKPTLVSPRNMLLMYDVLGGLYAVFCSDLCRAQCQQVMLTAEQVMQLPAVTEMRQAVVPPQLPVVQQTNALPSVPLQQPIELVQQQTIAPVVAAQPASAPNSPPHECHVVATHTPFSVEQLLVECSRYTLLEGGRAVPITN